MAGIYIHIPYCKKACHYCDFHFSTNQSNKDDMLEAILKEIELQKDYLQEKIDTIYFGGGTPSILSASELTQILDRLKDTFDIVDKPEITLEANPDDLNKEKIIALSRSEINRLSIGVQTFDDARLVYINRAHTKEEALNAIKGAQDSGFSNMSIDLIYAIPPSEMDYWEKDLSQAIRLEVPHISLYGLTIEPLTVFGKWEKKKKFHAVEESIAAKQYKLAIDTLKNVGYDQYEVSNFGKKGYYSKHNNSYWNQKSYLGIGPGAHSFNLTSRQHNIRNNTRYIKSIINENMIPAEKEVLSDIQIINEYLLTKLRTMEGIDYNYLLDNFDFDLRNKKSKEIGALMNQGLIEKTAGSIVLSVKGLMVADEIALILFLED